MTTFRRTLTFIGLIFLSTLVRAEGGCPPGQYPQQGPGWQTCVPIPGYESDPAPNQKPVRYINQWISFAVDADNGAFGITSDRSSRESAMRTAIDGCKLKGGKSCTNVGTVLNMCMAITLGDKNMYVDSDSDQRRSESKSIDDCNRGDSNCQMHYSMCAEPIRVNL